ncbi:MAG: hypothetical protein ACTSSB_12640, partial [Candidatus Heimdallarchaeota archaeon]
LLETAKASQPPPNKETEVNDKEIVEKTILHRQVSTKELDAFINDLRTTYFESLINSTEEEIIKDLAKQIEKNILMTIGMTESKK